MRASTCSIRTVLASNHCCGLIDSTAAPRSVICSTILDTSWEASPVLIPSMTVRSSPSASDLASKKLWLRLSDSTSS